MIRDHSFPRQIFRKSVRRFSKFRGMPWNIDPIPRPVLIIPRMAFFIVLGMVVDVML